MSAPDSEPTEDSAVREDSATPDVVSDRPDPVDVQEPTDTGTPACTAANTFACGAIRCSLFEVCAQSRAGDRCYAPTARDRCTPCSTQFASALPRDFCAAGLREYDGDSSVGCIVRCN